LAPAGALEALRALFEVVETHRSLEALRRLYEAFRTLYEAFRSPWLEESGSL